MKTATFDIETNGFLDVTDRVHCAAIKDHATGDIKSFTPDSIHSLCNYLDTFDVLIGHNCVAFDFPVLKKIFGWEYKGQIVDTVLMSRLQRPSRTNPAGYKGHAPHSVEAWGHRLGEYKKEHEDWSVYSPAMLARCEGDVSLQYRIHEALLEEGEGMGWENAHKLNVKIFQYLHQQEEYGFTVDQEHLDACLHTLERWIDRIGAALTPRLPFVVDVLETKKEGEYNHVKKPFLKNGNLNQHVINYFEKHNQTQLLSAIAGPFSRVAGRRINLGSNGEVKTYLLDQGWIPEEWNEKDGQRTSPKLSKNDSFRGINGSVGRLIAKRVQCRQRHSVLTGWKSAVRPDGRISTGVGGVATTGRLRHRVVVNIPSPDSGAFYARQMRQCFKAKEGWVVVGCDSKGNQMRQLAGRMGDEEFTNAVLHGTKEEGTDLHSLNQRISGAANRTLAKNFFYGSILFGAGAKKTGELLNTTTEKAKQIKEDYLDGMPKLRALLDSLSKEWRKTAKQRFNKKWNKVELYGGYITGIDGRSVLVTLEKDLLCYALQSDEAIQMGVAYVMVHKWAEERGWKHGVDWGMLIWMHDEFQMECSPENAEELGQLANRAIAWAGEFLNIKCPHDGDYMIGANWYETH